MSKKEYLKKYYQKNKKRLRKLYQKYYFTHLKEAKEYNYRYRIKNQKKIKLQNKIYREKNLKKLRKLGRKWYKEHKKEKALYDQEYRQKNKFSIAKKIYGYNLKHKKQKQEYDRQYRIKNRLKLKLKSKKYRQLHKKELYRKIIERRKRLDVKITNILRSRVRLALKGNPKIVTTMKLVGCSFKVLKEHLQKQFKKGMSWKNYGRYGWHIDHIKPCCKFDLNKPSEQKKCFNYKNLQPLWARENLSKGGK